MLKRQRSQPRFLFRST